MNSPFAVYIKVPFIIHMNITIVCHFNPRISTGCCNIDDTFAVIHHYLMSSAGTQSNHLMIAVDVSIVHYKHMSRFTTWYF